jgi:hypothetical protein
MIAERRPAELAELRAAVDEASAAPAGPWRVTRRRGLGREVDDAHRRDRVGGGEERRRRTHGLGRCRGPGRRAGATRLERAPARRAVPEARGVHGVANRAALLAPGGRSRGEGGPAASRRHPQRGRRPRTQRERLGRCVRSGRAITTPEPDGRCRWRDPRSETLPALLAERQVRRVRTSARRARHSFSGWDNTDAAASSGLVVPLTGTASRRST